MAKKIMGEMCKRLVLLDIERWWLDRACAANGVSADCLEETLYMAADYETAMDHIIWFHGNGVDPRGE